MPLVSVILDQGYDAPLRAASLATLEAQTYAGWEVVASLADATGEYVAFLDAGDLWVPDRLERLVDVRRPVVADELEGIRANGETVVFRTPVPEVEPVRLLIRRDLLDGFDLSSPAWPLDLFLSRELDAHLLERIGVRRRFPDRRTALRPVPGSHRHAVLNRHLVDWPDLAERQQVPGLSSVVVPTFDDAELTTACVESIVGAGGDVEVVVWDNGSGREVAERLVGLRRPGVHVVGSPINHGFALGNNQALPHCHGDVVVFLNNDTVVPSGWLEPLREALADDLVLGVQPLLLYPSGAVQSAGIAFPTCGGLPHQFLQGFPAEDAAGVDALAFHALTGAALALRYADVVALSGFDPIYTNGMEDVDLCHRLAQRRPGRFRVATAAPVVHFESRTPGRYDKHLANRAVYLDRWHRVAEPRDDADLWATRGLRVVDHEIGPTRHREPPRLRVPKPVLVRASRLSRAQVTDAPPRLRWAIKNPAPAGEGGDRWGDTPFAASLAAGLREIGQEVVVDRRPELDRATGRHDDVVLVLRGLVRHDPSPEQVSILWVISHPDEVSGEEARGYDRVAAASVGWADRRAREWGLPVEPVLQATDPARFRPDAGKPGTGHDVLFVGNSRWVLRPVVRDALAAGLPLAVYGDLWAGLVPDEVVVARSLPHDDLAAAYRSAGVVLNDHHADMRSEGFVSNRLFDAVASGARVISDDLPGVAELFGPSVQVYADAGDLRRLASLPDPDAVFGDDEARRAAAERVRRDHSFAARARRLLELALDARRERGFAGPGAAGVL